MIIIKADTPMATNQAKRWRDGEDFHTVMLIPAGLERVFVTERSVANTSEIVVLCQKGAEILDLVSFGRNEKRAWLYARAVAEEAGLPEEAVSGDVSTLDINHLQAKILDMERFIRSIDQWENYQKFL